MIEPVRPCTQPDCKIVGASKAAGVRILLKF